MPKKLDNNGPTSEELFIQNYFKEVGIKFQEEYKIDGLYGDDKQYRVVDFYLPRFNIYVEYFGMYNSTKLKRAEYQKKVDIYIKNHIPTVFIYPHELGFLDYAFHTKFLRVLRLKKFENKWRTFKYKAVRYWAYGSSYLFFLSILSLYLSLVFGIKETGLTEDVNTWIFALFFAVFWVALGHFLIDLFKYFIRDK